MNAVIQIGATIKKYRLKAGRSQRWLAMKANISPTYLCLVENGRKEPGINLVKNLCEYLEIQPEILFWESVEITEDVLEEDKRIFSLARSLLHHYFNLEQYGQQK